MNAVAASTANGRLFTQVSQILTDLVQAWSDRTGYPPHLDIHGETFQWETAEQLRNAKAFAKRLIAPELIGSGRGAETNLVLALATDRFGARMPIGGPYLSDAEVQVLVDWIDAGAPD